MHEGAGELDQAFIEIAVGLFATREPEIFQHIMRFVELAAIEQIEVSDVMRVVRLADVGFDHFGYLLTFPGDH
jgi:hypothetical protein